MERSERLATSVTPETKQKFRIQAAKSDMTMSEYLREIVLREIEDTESDSENRSPAATLAD